MIPTTEVIESFFAFGKSLKSTINIDIGGTSDKTSDNTFFITKKERKGQCANCKNTVSTTKLRGLWTYVCYKTFTTYAEYIDSFFQSKKKHHNPHLYCRCQSGVSGEIFNFETNLYLSLLIIITFNKIIDVAIKCWPFKSIDDYIELDEQKYNLVSVVYGNGKHFIWYSISIL